MGRTTPRVIAAVGEDVQVVSTRTASAHTNGSTRGARVTHQHLSSSAQMFDFVQNALPIGRAGKGFARRTTNNGRSFHPKKDAEHTVALDLRLRAPDIAA
jgi:hypothetical protein